ncbi:MAG: ferritin-like domain-containing protein [Pararhodobacter sp.]
MKTKTLDDLFLDMLKDIYYAERKILKALPKMARGAQSPELRAAFEKHHGETQIQIERLQQVFELLGKPARGKTCPAIEGIIEEGEEVLEEFKDSPALDAGLVAAAQAVEHYEMARYGTLTAWATLLGQKDAAKLLQETLAEEEATDSALTQLAGSSVNKSALQAA